MSKKRKPRSYTSAELDAYTLDPIRGDNGEIQHYNVIIAGDTLGTIERPLGHNGWQARQLPSGIAVRHNGRGRYAKTRENAVLDLLIELGITTSDH